MKKLLLKTISTKETISAGELVKYLSNVDPDVPIVLKCGKNFRLSKFEKKATSIVLTGRRTGLK